MKLKDIIKNFKKNKHLNYLVVINSKMDVNDYLELRKCSCCPKFVLYLSDKKFYDYKPTEEDLNILDWKKEKL